MKSSIYFRHRFHQNIINGFNLSFPDVQKLMIERGVDIYMKRFEAALIR